MPYPGVPSSLTKKMESCVAQVMKGGKDKKSAIAICHSRLVPKKDLTLMERDDTIRYAWAEAVRESSDEQLRYSWPSYIFDDYLVIRYAGKYVKIGYKMGGSEGVRFDEPKKWMMVEHSFKSQADASDGTTHQVIMEPIRAVVEQTEPEGESKTWYKGYVYIFGDEDHKDLKGTYFDRRTEAHLDWWPVKPWLYHHGLHPMVGSMRVGEWREGGEDEKGIFLKGEMDESFKFKEQARTLIENEMLYTSSGALGYLVRVEEDGHMAEWPVAELSSTVKPAEFRIQPITEAVASAIRTLEGGIDMAGKGDERGGLFKILPWLRSAEDAGVQEEVSPAPPTAPVEQESTPPVESPATEVVESGVISSEIARSEDLEIVKRSVENLVGVIDTLRQGIEAVAGKVSSMEASVRGLQQNEASRVKDIVIGKDWVRGLFSATRDGEAVSEEQVPPKELHGTPVGDPASPASRIISAQQRR